MSQWMKLVGRRVWGAAAGAAGLGQSRGCRRQGPAAAAGPAHRVTRAKIKKSKNKSQKIKKNKPRAPPHIYFG